jgi:hypothetical protein
MKTLKIFKKYFISNYERMKLSISLMLGITAIIFLILYLIGCLMHLWEYNIIDVIFNPIAGAILVVIPLYSIVITVRFFSHCKTRTLFYRIIRKHRNRIKFLIQREDDSKSDCETRLILWGNYKNFPFRFIYSPGHPLMISLVTDMKNFDILSLNKLFDKPGLKERRFDGDGITLDVKKPFASDKISRITEKLDVLVDDFHKLKLNTTSD